MARASLKLERSRTGGSEVERNRRASREARDGRRRERGRSDGPEGGSVIAGIESTAARVETRVVRDERDAGREGDLEEKREGEKKRENVMSHRERETLREGERRRKRNEKEKERERREPYLLIVRHIARRGIHAGTVRIVHRREIRNKGRLPVGAGDDRSIERLKIEHAHDPLRGKGVGARRLRRARRNVDGDAEGRALIELEDVLREGDA